MKVLICFIAACLCITMPPLSAQDIESTLSGNTVNQGFTVKDGNGMPLFTVRGEGSVGIGTTLPTAVLTVSGLDGFLVKGTSGSGSIPTSGAGTRLMFYPKKAAFRAGEVTGTQWSDGNIGTHSTATGYNTTASGDYSTAIGHQTNASGRASTAMGYLTTVSGAYATAIGDMTNASGDYSTAIGALTVASGEYATATGYSTTASGSCSTAMGNHTTASGNYSTAIGNWVNTGSKMGSCVIGDNSTTTTFSAGSVNRFYGRFANGYCLYTNSGCSIAAILYGNANSWSTLSDVRKKEGFLPADGETILERFRALRLGTWNYIGQPAEQYRHYGPMAQEWFAAFGRDGVGAIGNDTTLASADVDGVLCIAVQALEKRTAQHQENVAELKAQLLQKDQEIAQLREQLATQKYQSDSRYSELVKMVQSLKQEHQEQDQRQVLLLPQEEGR